MRSSANAPTPERLRRATWLSLPAIGTESEPARAGTRMYRSLSTVERLLRDGSIRPRQAEAADRLRSDFELGVAGARDAAGSGGAHDWHYAEARLSALRRYQEAKCALGVVAPYVLPLCLLEASLSEFARSIGRNRQEVAGIVKLGLDILADHYGLA